MKKKTLTVASALVWAVVTLATPTHAQSNLGSERGAPRTSMDVRPRDALAEEIIRVLRENPALMLEAKSQITAELARRGLPVSDAELTDARIFDQIRKNPDFRDLIGSELNARGHIDLDSFRKETDKASESEAEPEVDMQESEPAPADEGRGDKNGKPGNGPKDQVRSGVPQLKTKPNPYRDVPALADLYRQFSMSFPPPPRFGADFFRSPDVARRVPAGTSALEIPLGTDYVLGPGDGLAIDIHGSFSQRLSRTVDHEGRISLPEAGNVLVGGRTIAAAQVEIERALRVQFRQVTVELSVNRLRRVRVYVVGDVKKPGAYEVSSLSTVLTALLTAGGPTDVGSWRTVRLVRERQLVKQVDLYELMLHGVTNSEIPLLSGDTILIPPAGPQVTVSGMVRRPAIYELASETSLRQVLELAGGVMVAGQLSNIKVERIQAHSRREMINVSLEEASATGLEKVPVSDGDLITVAPILPYSDRVVYLQGHVFRPGKYPYREHMTLLDLIPSFQDLLPEPADAAEVVRLRPPDLRPVVLSFDLRGMLEGRVPPLKLEPFDTVRTTGRYENDAPTVSIFGEVVRPGEYPLSNSMTASELVRMAGGFRRSAFRRSADLSSYIADGDRVSLDHREVEIGKAADGDASADVSLKAGDVLTIRQLGQWSEIGGSINITGAVLYPGRYGIQQGERLSAVLKRAGGFLSDAYPAGAVLDRGQVREISRKSKEQLVQRLESQGADVTRDVAAEVRGAAGQQRQRLIERLKSAPPNGRLVIRLESDLSAWENTPADIEIRPGDSLFIPKKPNFVIVDGQVYSPSAITFAPGKKASWYLRQAGGPTEFANRKDIFIVRANGSVIGRDSSGWWSGGVMATNMNPGDTLVVPEKIVSGSAFWRDLAQSAQVISAIAIAARVASSF